MCVKVAMEMRDACKQSTIDLSARPGCVEDNLVTKLARCDVNVCGCVGDEMDGGARASGPGGVDGTAAGRSGFARQFQAWNQFTMGKGSGDRRAKQEE